MRDSSFEPHDGYAVISLNGSRIGAVAGITGESIIVEQGRWLRRFRALPMKLASVRHADRSVIALAEPDIIARSPSVKPDHDVDEEAVAAHYDAEHCLRAAETNRDRAEGNTT